MLPLLSRFVTVPFSAFIVAAALAGCSQASYEILRPANNKHGDEGTPQTFDGPSPDGPAKTDDAFPGPTASVQVILDSKSVTTVRTNDATTVRPSPDTLSSSFIGVSSCPNPGIIKADYTLAELSSPSVSRTTCETLGVPGIFPTARDILITMTVTDQRQKTAVSTMTLTVVDDQTARSGDGGFTITANPILQQVGKEILFNGYCETRAAHTISWNFDDGGTAKGSQANHAFAQHGSYLVKATCSKDDGSRTITASVTVVITNDAPTLPPYIGKPLVPSPFDWPKPSDTGTGQHPQPSQQATSGSYASSAGYFGNN